MEGAGSGFVAGSYVQGASLKGAATADRDVGSVAFDSPSQPPVPFTGNTADIGAGELTTFLVVRTSATSYRDAQVTISEGETAFASSFTKVPQPNAWRIADVATSGVLNYSTNLAAPPSA